MAIMPDHEVPHLIAVTGYPPNSAFGGGIILRNLLMGYPSDRMTIISNGWVTEELSNRDDGGGLLSATHVGIKPWRSRLPIARRMLRSLNVLKIIAATKAILAVCRGENRRAILAVPWGGELGSELFASAYLAHRLSGTPLIVYEMDEWRSSLGTESGLVARCLERLLHGPLLQSADSVWAISEAMAEVFLSRYRIDARVLSNCIDLQRFEHQSGHKREPTATFQILFTGAIYGAQVGAIRNVLKAVQSDEDQTFTLVLHTSQSSEELAKLDLFGPRLRVEPPVPADAMPELLSRADLLLLPFSFDSHQRAVVSTSFPTKTAEYLASGVPIIVHAPPYASIALAARAKEWAEVIDTQCVRRLISALKRLVSDTEYRNGLVANALNIARSDHDLTTRRAEFVGSIMKAACE